MKLLIQYNLLHCTLFFVGEINDYPPKLSNCSYVLYFFHQIGKPICAIYCLYFSFDIADVQSNSKMINSFGFVRSKSESSGTPIHQSQFNRKFDWKTRVLWNWFSSFPFSHDTQFVLYSIWTILRYKHW